MINIPSLRHETRYGLPTADHLLFNRQYIVGYSYLLRQPKWAMEVMDPDNVRVEIDQRLDSFRPDLRIPWQFRVELKDYKGAGFDRGHLIASADKRSDGILNSETFLLTNMSPQLPAFNRGIWKQLEEEVRNLSKKDKIVEVYVICGPTFFINKPVQVIGVEGGEKDVTVPIPHGFFKCILAEELRGSYALYAFMFPNEKCEEPIAKYRVTTLTVEMWTGLLFWDRLTGGKIERMKSRIGKKLWF